MKPLWKRVWQFLKKTTQRIIIGPSCSTPRYILKRSEDTHSHQTLYTLMYTAALFIIAKIGTQ